MTGSTSNNPLDSALYEKVKAEAKAKFRSWPSAYASGWLVREYKRRGGRYGSSRKPRKTLGLQRWFELEKWIDVCQLPRIVPCGRPGTLTDKQYWKNFPYCRPMHRASPNTPRLASDLSNKEIRRRCSLKKSLPKSRITSRRRRSKQ
jgi:hypothetical protein